MFFVAKLFGPPFLIQEKQNKLKQEVSTIEKNLIKALKNMEIEKSSDFLKKGKILLEDVIDKSIQEKWTIFETDFIKTKKKVNS